MRKENNTYVLRSNGNLDWGEMPNLVADDGTEIKKAPNYRCLIKNYIIGRIYQMIIVFLFFIIFIN